MLGGHWFCLKNVGTLTSQSRSLIVFKAHPLLCDSQAAGKKERKKVLGPNGDKENRLGRKVPGESEWREGCMAGRWDARREKEETNGERGRGWGGGWEEREGEGDREREPEMERGERKIKRERERGERDRETARQTETQTERHRHRQRQR